MTAHGRRPLTAPPIRLALLEQYSAVEYATLALAGPWRSLVPAGHGQPVLVLPGFGGSDRSTKPMRDLLKQRGFAVHGWRLGPNVGPHPHIIDGLHQRLDELGARYATEISLVGWSLGGVYARELARLDPDAVRQVITLASPFRMRDDDRGRGSSLYNRLAPSDEPFPGRDRPEHVRPPLPVPSTAIYSRTDGVVRWQACIESEGPERENISVRSTHNGMGVNLAALAAIADRLAQPAGAWHPFHPRLALRGWYRRPDHWRPT